jgi:acyl-CoA thioester hydrolase
MFTREIDVRFSDCDGLGHVNNGVYFVYMEEARADIFRLFVQDVRLSEWNLIVASARCDFLRQVTYGQRLSVFTWIGSVGNSSFVVEHALRDDTGAYVGRGQGTLLHYDYAVGTPQPLPADVRRQLLAHGQGPEDAPALR